MNRTTRLTISLLACVLCVLIPINSASLTFDMTGTGKQSGFLVNNLGFEDTPPSTSFPSNYSTNSNTYGGSAEVWTYPGFVGRLDYMGEPTTMTFTNTGPQRTSSPNSMFYFTYQTGGSNTSRYREFFIVTRVKGLLQNGSTQVDFNGNNFVVIASDDSIQVGNSTTGGAGTETAEVGQIGYNTSGQSATYTGSNAYSYKYRYKVFWVDVILISTDKKNSTNTRGYYESTITANTTTGVNYTLQLMGEYNPRSSHAEPWNYYFGVEKVLPDNFPFSDLATKNTSANSLNVGSLRYYSTDDPAIVYFASDSQGTQTNFLLTSPGAPSFAYSVVFDPTIPNTPASTILNTTTTFNSIETSVASPLGGSNSGHFLEGEVKIFVAPNLLPLSGNYSSTIYCCITRGS